MRLTLAMTLWCVADFLFMVAAPHMPHALPHLFSRAITLLRPPHPAPRMTGIARLPACLAAAALLYVGDIAGFIATAQATEGQRGPMASLASAQPDAIGQIIDATPSPEDAAEAIAAPAQAAPSPDAQAANRGEAPLPDAAMLDWSPLQTDPAALIDRAVTPPANLKRADRAPLINPQQTEITRQRATASATELSVEKPLPVDLNMKIGADMDVHAAPSFYTPHQALGPAPASGTSGGDATAKAWASLSAPGFSTLWDKTRIKAGVDPQSQQRSFETSLVKSVPLGDQLKIVVENSYKTNQPLADNSSTGASSHADHAIDQRATLTVLPTETSLTASNNFQASNDKWLKKIGAEQKIFGGVSVTGSLGETADGDINKSIGAAYKRNW